MNNSKENNIVLQTENEPKLEVNEETDLLLRDEQEQEPTERATHNKHLNNSIGSVV
jgi:hypothetical protein